MLKEGAKNSKFFHFVVKSRNVSNKIVKLTNDEGVILEDIGKIKHEVLSFYERLLGISKTELLGVDTSILKSRQ